MKTNQLKEAFSCLFFNNSRKSENLRNHIQSLLRGFSVIILALLLPLGVFAQSDLPPAPQLALDNVPEASDYGVLYELDVPNTATWTTGVPYTMDNSDEAIACFERVAFLVQKEDRVTGRFEWIWVSMDAYSNNLKQLGLPQKDEPGRDFSHQQIVDNLSVIASANTGIATRDNVATGNIEMWNYGYTQVNGAGIPNGSDTTYDWGDTNTGTDCYGSFQVHDHGAQEVLFAYNRWGIGGTSDFGIGNNPSTNAPDYTFKSNAASYINKKIYVLIGGALPTPNPICNDITVNLDDDGLASIELSDVYGGSDNDDCVANVEIDQNMFDCTHVGENTVVVTLTDVNGNITTCESTVTVISNPAVCTPADCICVDGMAELTIEYSGGAGADITAKDADVTDNGDGTYTISDNGDKLKKDLKIKINGDKIDKIHTSCSEEILGDVFDGVVTVIGYIDLEGNVTNIESCPIIPDCECKGGMVEVIVAYDGGGSVTSNSGMVTDNGDGTYTIYDGGEKLEKNLEVYVDGNTAEIHTSCSQDVLGVTFDGGVTVIGYIDNEGNVTTLEGCGSTAGPDCECKGGMVEVIVAYDGGGSVTSNSGMVTDNGDGTYTIYDGGEKLEKNLEIYTGESTAEVHTSCSQDVLGVTFDGGVTVVGYTDNEGNITALDGCSQAPGPDCECEGGLVEVIINYDGGGTVTSNSGTVTDNGDGTYTISNNGVKLEKNLEIYTGESTAEVHTSCSQDILGETFSGGVTVIGYTDTKGSVSHVDTCPFDGGGTDCECKGGLVEVTVAYDGGGSVSSNSGTVTDNGDGTYTIYDGGEKLEKNLEVYVDGNTAEIHTSCSQDVLGVTFSGGVTVIGYTDNEGNMTTLDGCSQAPGPDCECEGGLVEVIVAYDGGGSVSSNSGTVTNNGDGTYTIYNGGEKLEKNLEIYAGGSTAEVHTSCSQEVLGVTFSGVTVIGYTDSKGSVSHIDTCPVDPPECDCKGGLVEVIVSYTGGGSVSSNSGTVTNNGDGTYTIYDGGEKLEKNLEIYAGGNTAEVHTSCSQDILGVTFSGGVKVISHTDSDGNVCSVDDDGNSGEGRIASTGEKTKDQDTSEDELAKTEDELITGFSVKTWPVPSGDDFNIKVLSDNSRDKVHINVMDITGKSVHVGTFDGNTLYKFGDKLSSGIYFARIKQGDNQEIKRLVKY